MSLKKIFGLEGRVALVTGASGYLGKSLAKGLCEAGAHVILNGRRKAPLEKLAKELREKGHKAAVACFDVTSSPAMKKAFKRIAAEHPRLDIVVNNAYAGDDFLQAYKVSVMAAYEIIRAAKPLLVKAAKTNPGGASIVNISSMYGSVSPDPSIYGQSGENNPPFYGPAKAALLQFTRYAACHLAPLNIRVNSISPGPFPRPEALKKNPSFHKKLREKNPMRRTGRPEELVGALIFLASGASSYVTGANIAVDGGWTAW
jgi:NAD(P)-dependent dehydrogenase (short-subunit alcohol dehydrogenase family)